MKKTILTLTTLLIIGNISFAQYTNWNSDNSENRNAVFMNIGYDYSLSLGAGYNHSFNIFTIPALFGVEFSKPMGDDLFDDHKIKIGAEVAVINKNNFCLSAVVKGIIRRNANEYVNIESFGSDLGLKAGIYKPNWYLAGEFGFDKAITSYLEHSDLYRDLYPQAKDGWYVPTAGQFYYGVITGFSIGNIVDINLKVGLTNAEGQQKNALLPYYAQLGLSKSF